MKTVQAVPKHKNLIMDITAKQYRFLHRESRHMELSISNYVRRAIGLPDVIQGERRDLRNHESAA